MHKFKNLDLRCSETSFNANGNIFKGFEQVHKSKTETQDIPKQVSMQTEMCLRALSKYTRGCIAPTPQVSEWPRRDARSVNNFG